MNRDDMICCSIGVFWLLGVIGTGVFETNTQPWLISGVIAMFGYLGYFGAFLIRIGKMIGKIIHSPACKEK